MDKEKEKEKNDYSSFIRCPRHSRWSPNEFSKIQTPHETPFKLTQCHRERINLLQSLMV